MKRPNSDQQYKSDRGGHGGGDNQLQQSSEQGQQYTDPVVFRVRRPSQCGKCKDELESGRMIKLVEADGGERIALCKICSGLGELFYVPAGNAKLTRLLSKYSKQKHVVVRWATARKRYERQGVLVELDALNRAETDLGMELTIDMEADTGEED